MSGKQEGNNGVEVLRSSDKENAFLPRASGAQLGVRHIKRLPAFLNSITLVWRLMSSS
ncbi:MAG: hypothetical protein LBL13_09335 [Bacteroidales bacterium]|nr:hypothetical protein [Bacteroidales bacterium]